MPFFRDSFKDSFKTLQQQEILQGSSKILLDFCTILFHLLPSVKHRSQVSIQGLHIIVSIIIKEVNNGMLLIHHRTVTLSTDSNHLLVNYYN